MTALGSSNSVNLANFADIFILDHLRMWQMGTVWGMETGSSHSSRQSKMDKPKYRRQTQNMTSCSPCSPSKSGFSVSSFSLSLWLCFDALAFSAALESRCLLFLTCDSYYKHPSLYFGSWTMI